MSKKSAIQTKIHTYKFDNVEFQLTDYHVGFNLNEDELYEDLDFWLSLTRGRAEIRVGEQLVHTLVGLRKYGDANENFGYGFNENWDHCFTTVKENGECYHFSAFIYNSELYSVIGSKNVHIIIKMQDDIHQQLQAISETQTKRVSFAVDMANFFFSNFSENLELFNFVAQNKLCFVGESINPQNEHIVAYTERNIKFFAITQSTDQQEYLYTRYSPSEAFKIFEKFGLPTVDWVKCSTPAELEFEKNKVQLEENCEGIVIYYCDANGNVTYIHKYKNDQYALLRTVRQLWRSGTSLLNFRKRLDNYHFKIEAKEKAEWIQFYSWLVNTVDKSKRFSYDLYTEWKTLTSAYNYNREQIVVILVGIPGSGKTTIGSQLQANLVVNGINAVYTDQDLFHGDNKAYGENLQSLCSNENYKVVIQGRSNINAHQREFARSFVTGQRIIYVVTRVDEAGVEECISRVKSREFHQFLKADKAEAVCKSFLSSFEMIGEKELDENSSVIELDLLSSIESKVNTVLGKIRELGGFQSAIEFGIYPKWVMCNYISIKLEYGEMLQKLDFETFNGLTADFDKVIRDVHVTLWHRNSGDFMKGIQASNWVGKKVVVRCEKICWNDEIAALFLTIEDLEVKSSNKWPHVTLKRKKGVPPVNSNFILEGEHKTMAVDFILSGTVVRN